MTEGTAVPVIAGLAAGIGFVMLFAIMIPTVRAPPTSANPLSDQYRRHVDMEIVGLKNWYKAGERIDFSLKVKGFDALCDLYPDIVITNSTRDEVWTYEPVSLMGCGDPDINSPHTILANWNMSQIETPVNISQTGSYTLKATYYDKTVEREFNVTGRDDYDKYNPAAESISPGTVPFHSCPAIFVQNSVKVLNSTGFSVYNASSSDFADYVIERGQKGTISFTISRGGPPTIIGNPDFGIPEKDTFENNVIFIHRREVTVEQNITSWVVEQFGNKTNVTFYQACHDLPADAGGGTECYSGPADHPPSKTTTVPVTSFDHPGINASFEPEIEVLGFSESVTVKATFLVDSNAPQGTYWMALPPGMCNGSPIVLFTVGNDPFGLSENDSVFAYPPASG